jgi:transposase
MMVVGIDPHKQTHTAVAVDQVGRKLAAKTVKARRDGHFQLLAWAQAQARAAGQDLAWAVEDVRHVAGNLVRDLLAAGQAVVFVPPKLMAGERRGGRERGKSDPIDALAIARLALREDGHLPAARLDEATRPLRLLTDHRDVLVRDRTAIVCRLRWHLHELDPALAPAARALSKRRPRAALAAALAALPPGPVHRIAASELARIETLSQQIDALETEITTLVTAAAPALLTIPGAGPLTAAKILGETAGIRRFRSPAAFARHNGTAPIPASSGNSTTVRLSRAGNRQLNAAIHRIAITQARYHTPARTFLAGRASKHETKRASLRALKRHLSDIVYHALITDAGPAASPTANINLT